MKEGNIEYPKGCGPKLIKFASDHGSIRLHVIYDEVYAGNPANPDDDVRQSSLHVLTQMDQISTLHIYLFEQYAVSSP